MIVYVEVPIVKGGHIILITCPGNVGVKTNLFQQLIWHYKL